MRWSLYILILLSSVFCFSCKEQTDESENTDPVLEKIAGKNYAELIEIPTTPDGQVDTSQMALITFETTVFDFDTLFQGDKVEYSFNYSNTGVKDLYILQTNSACGCTVSDYSKEPIGPGESGSIKVVFNSEGKKGIQNRKISVITNAFPSEKVLSVKGYVKLNE